MHSTRNSVDPLVEREHPPHQGHICIEGKECMFQGSQHICHDDYCQPREVTTDNCNRLSPGKQAPETVKIPGNLGSWGREGWEGFHRTLQ